jgi:hypothetical protein
MQDSLPYDIADSLQEQRESSDTPCHGRNKIKKHLPEVPQPVYSNNSPWTCCSGMLTDSVVGCLLYKLLLANKTYVCKKHACLTHALNIHGFTACCYEHILWDDILDVCKVFSFLSIIGLMLFV